jgi:glutamate carboxypeptidase
VTEHADHELAALETVVNIESATQNLAGVREVGAWFRKELEALAFTARWVAMPESMHRAGHLFAERAGDPKGRRVLLLGHLDTVLEGRASASGAREASCGAPASRT